MATTSPTTAAPQALASSPAALIGICLCDETSTVGQVIGTVLLQNSSSCSLSQLRKELTTSFSNELRNRHLTFLTAKGWEINENLENVVNLTHVLTDDETVNIRFSYDEPRVGIVIEGPPDISVGFVFCASSCSVAELGSAIASQLPSLHSSLSSRQYCFLDRNGWPISKVQEAVMRVIDISFSQCVKIRCARSSSSYSRKTSMIDEKKSLIPQLSITDSMPVSIPFLPADDERSLTPIGEQPDSMEQQQWKSTDYTDMIAPVSDLDPFEILLSYVHTEASNYALLLKNALEKQGYSVFLDIHCIEGGKDWQDVLNSAITNCTLFVPLITMQYGQTLWTNREVKLADVLQKMILPVNFNKTWPPKCLAIQFATTQYIPGSQPTQEITLENFSEDNATEIAVKIAEQYKKIQMASRVSDDSASVGAEMPPLMSRQSTEIIVSTPGSAGLKVPTLALNLTRRRSAIKSYASNLPETVPEQYRMAMFESRVGKPLIVISCHSKQLKFADGLAEQLQKKDCEVWCSCNADQLSDEEKSALFQNKVNEAGAVVFILSKDFAEDTFCEQQVYYCEQRKRIIPLIYEPIEMPNWMTTLIGTSTFIDCKSQTYLKTFINRVMTALNPNKIENELKEVIQQKMELATLCSDLDQQLPEGEHVYISGGTKFFSKTGEAISKEIGRLLAHEDNIVVVTGGFYGVGEAVGRSCFEERERLKKPPNVYHVVAVKDEEDKSNQTRQNPDGTFQTVPYGQTLFFGSSVRQREMLTPRVIDLCILIEGGPGAAFEAQQFVWNGNRVIPVRVTGGAAGGSFNVPPIILLRPPNVSDSDWSLLGDGSATPTEVASAVVRIVKQLKNQELAVSGFRSRSGTDASDSNRRNVPLARLKRAKVVLKRSETVPKKPPKDGDSTLETLHKVKRALSESS